MDMDQIIHELETAGLAEGTELGDGWRALCDMWRACDSCTDIFISALETEIMDQYNYLINNFAWVDCNNPKCSHCDRGGSSYKTLVWNEDTNDHL